MDGGWPLLLAAWPTPPYHMDGGWPLLLAAWSTPSTIAWMMATCDDERFRDPKRSLQFAKKAIELNGGEDFQLLDTMAAAHANAGQFNYAVTEQQRAIEMATGKATGRELYDLKQRLQQYSQQAPHRTEVIARQSDRSERIQ